MFFKNKTNEECSKWKKKKKQIVGKYANKSGIHIHSNNQIKQKMEIFVRSRINIERMKMNQKG